MVVRLRELGVERLRRGKQGGRSCSGKNDISLRDAMGQQTGGVQCCGVVGMCSPPNSPRVVKSLMSMLFAAEEEPTPMEPAWGRADGRSFAQSSRDDGVCLCDSC